MNRYELLILASPEITKDEETNLEKNIDKFIVDAKGSIVSFDRWGKYRLAYPVKGNSYGVYFLVRFDIENADVLQELKRMFYVKFVDVVMRQMVTKLDKDASAEYKRPPSLEDTPKRHIGFLEESELKHGSTSLKDVKKDKEKKDVVVEEKIVEVVEPLRQASDSAKATTDMQDDREEGVTAKETEKMERAASQEDKVIEEPAKDDEKNEDNRQEV